MKIKKHLRSFVFNLTAIWIVSLLVEGFVLEGGNKTLLLTALALSLVNFFVRPLIKLLFLPVNLLTLGAFRWLINVIALYVVTLLVPQLKIKAFLFAGYTYQGFVIPQIHLGVFLCLVLSSLMLSLIVSFIYWLTK